MAGIHDIESAFRSAAGPGVTLDKITMDYSAGGDEQVFTVYLTAPKVVFSKTVSGNMMAADIVELAKGWAKKVSETVMDVEFAPTEPVVELKSGVIELGGDPDAKAFFLRNQGREGL